MESTGEKTVQLCNSLLCVNYDDCVGRDRLLGSPGRGRLGIPLSSEACSVEKSCGFVFFFFYGGKT